jgi:hypothetical protein
MSYPNSVAPEERLVLIRLEVAKHQSNTETGQEILGLVVERSPDGYERNLRLAQS